MKSAVVMLCIMFAVGIAVFGFPGSLCQSGGSPCCIAEMIQNKICPVDASPLAHANFLIEAFKSFSVATLDYNTLFLALCAILFVHIYFVGGFLRDNFLRKSVVTEQPLQLYQKLHVPLAEHLRRWLMLREKGDPVLLR